MGDFVGALLGCAAGGLGAYVAIKSDLAKLQAQVANLTEAIGRAHIRIDDLLSRDHK